MIDNINCISFGYNPSHAIPEEYEPKPVQNDSDNEEELDDKAVLEQLMFSKAIQLSRKHMKHFFCLYSIKLLCCIYV